MAGHLDAEDLLQAVVDVQEIERLGAQVADEGAVGGHLSLRRPESLGGDLHDLGDDTVFGDEILHDAPFV